MTYTKQEYAQWAITANENGQALTIVDDKPIYIDYTTYIIGNKKTAGSHTVKDIKTPTLDDNEVIMTTTYPIDGLAYVALADGTWEEYTPGEVKSTQAKLALAQHVTTKEDGSSSNLWLDIETEMKALDLTVFSNMQRYILWNATTFHIDDELLLAIASEKGLDLAAVKELFRKASKV